MYSGQANLRAMTHAGETIKKAVESHGMKHAVLAEKLEISRQSLYNLYENVEVDLTMILRIGKLINYDFKELISRPEYRNDPRVTTILDGNRIDYQAQAEYWKDKYITLLESLAEILTAREKNQLKP